jgi:hypothetical protein
MLSMPIWPEPTIAKGAPNSRGDILIQLVDCMSRLKIAPPNKQHHTKQHSLCWRSIENSSAQSSLIRQHPASACLCSTHKITTLTNYHPDLWTSIGFRGPNPKPKTSIGDLPNQPRPSKVASR